MSRRIGKSALDQIFMAARTHNAWLPKEVPDSLLKELVEVMRMGPTSANCSPARIIFVKSKAAKERLKPHLSSGNRDKTMAAPVTAIVGFDRMFYEHLPKLFPHNPAARSWFTKSEEHALTTAFRNGSLQGAYLIVAARALGLDAGPMSGFDNAGVDREFFAGTTIRSNFLCNLGYGDPSGLRPRSPRLEFEDLAQII
jgi:3-hydroxypropanoate dehydrogenase